MKKALPLITFLLVFSIQPLLSADLTILTENLPPLNYVKDGKLVGPSVDIVKEIQKRTGSHEEIMVFPWARAYSLALEEENVVLFGMTYTEVRKDLFKWVCPLATKRDILIAKKSSKITINHLDDAKEVQRIGTLRDDTKERFLISHGFTNLEPVSDERKNAKKLMLGRIDLWVYKKPGLKTVCELAGVDYNQLEEVFHLRKKNLCIAFSKKTSDSIVQKWQDAFNEMLADGTTQHIQGNWDIEE